MPSLPPTAETPFETDADGRFRATARIIRPLHGPGISSPGTALSEPADARVRVDQRGHRASSRPGLAEGSHDPRQGDRRGLRKAHRRDDARLSLSVEPRRLQPIPGLAARGRGRMGHSSSRSRRNPTYLIVLGPSEDYVLQEIGERMIQQGQPGGRRMYAHAFIAYDLKSGGDTREVHVVLRRGMTVKGQVVGPDGQPVQDARMVSRIILMPIGVPWRSWQGEYHGHVRNGRFELHGLATDPEVPVFFLEPKRRLGAMVNLSGKSGSGGPITVRPRVLRHGQGAARRLLGKAARGVSRPVSHRDGRHSRPVLVEPRSRRTRAAWRPTRLPLPDRSHQLPGWFCL